MKWEADLWYVHTVNVINVLSYSIANFLSTSIWAYLERGSVVDVEIRGKNGLAGE